MCCEPSGYKEDQVNGKCPDCGEETVDGDALESCYYSRIECETCGYAPCDGSC
jgi:predicted RNA-binding Zn-ribbon protein involved in translation (DUF1610 family)